MKKLKIRLIEKYSFYPKGSEYMAHDYGGNSYAIYGKNDIDFIPKKYAEVIEN